MVSEASYLGCEVTGGFLLLKLAVLGITSWFARATVCHHTKEAGSLASPPPPSHPWALETDTVACLAQRCRSAVLGQCWVAPLSLPVAR